MFYTKNYQTNHQARTWQQALQKREVERNNYHVTGDIKKAKEFVKMVDSFIFQTTIANTNEQIIFARI